MTDMFDYLLWRGDLAIEKDSFNEVDGIIMAALSYIPFELIKEHMEGKISLGKAAELILEIPDIEEKLLFKKDYRLLCEVIKSERFKNILLSGYENFINTETQTQFSAITATLEKKLHCVCFRGTDDNLIGWKEDFNMAFVSPVPGQKSAVKYLEKSAGRLSGKLIVCGHSKGGNFAIYASAFCKKTVKRRIEHIYNYDGPGFTPEILESEGYKSICKKIRTFVPQSSVVGMLLEHEDDFTIVSSHNIGLLQHGYYSWEVEGRGFVCLEEVTNNSKVIDRTLKKWLYEMSNEQRENFIEAIYGIVEKTNATTIKELTDNWFSSAIVILRSVKNLDEPTRKAVNQALGEFVRCARESLVSVGTAEMKNFSEKIKGFFSGNNEEKKFARLTKS